MNKSVNTCFVEETKYNHSYLNSFQRLCKNLTVKSFDKFSDGCIRLTDTEGSITLGNPKTKVLVTELDILDGNVYTKLVLGGSIGAAEAYMDGLWTTSDLTTVIRILARNQHVLKDMDSGAVKISAAINKIIHLFRRNNRDGSKKNIAAHYDLGNDFYKLFLDQTMMYSSGIFSEQKQSLFDASENKLKIICDKLSLNKDDHVIEIGTGWGGFAIYAATHYGCRVTTTTISKEQYNYAKEKIEALGLNDKITLLLQDYRDLSGQFDKLVSIEMIEAVGYEYYKDFFKQCNSLLKENGRMLLQAITINEQRYEKAKTEVDFIQRYIFPGGCLPSNTAIQHHITNYSNMRLVSMQEIGVSYAKTLNKWREAFLDRTEDVLAMGFPISFIRMWEFYFCYCEGGFLERTIGCSHLVFDKPDCRLSNIT